MQLNSIFPRVSGRIVSVKLVWIRGNPGYKGVTTSTSALAKELLESEYPVQGTAYFTYEDEKLTDRRDRMEKE